MATGGKIVFEDFSGKVTDAIEKNILEWLEEASNELTSQTIARAGTGAYYRGIAEKWDKVVDKTNYTAYIGNPLENAIWVEFGTGEYALNKDGRKGYWVFVKDSTGKSNKSTKQYTLQEAKQTVAFMRSQGLDAMYTKGTPPKRPLHHAFTTNESVIKDALKDKLRSM